MYSQKFIDNVFAVLLSMMILCFASFKTYAQSAPSKVVVPDWALPGSATHTQVPPPEGFHRAQGQIIPV